MTRTASLLIVNHITVEPEHPQKISAEILIGGQPDQVVLDFSLPQVVAYARMPDALERHPAAQRGVVELLIRLYRGKEVVLPADLSDIVRQASTPWPQRLPDFKKWAAAEIGAKVVPVTVNKAEQNQPGPSLTTIHLNFDGIPSIVVLDRRKGPDHAVHFRFVQGVHPWQLTSGEQLALLEALLAADQRPHSDQLS